MVNTDKLYLTKEESMEILKNANPMVGTHINACVHYDYRTTKPSKEETILINNSIGANHYAMKNLAGMAFEIGQCGRTWNGCTFKEDYNSHTHDTYFPRRKSHFKTQQLFGLDFDNGITWDEVKSRADKYNLHISFAYETFSSVNYSKFRVVFLHEFEIIHVRVAESIVYALMTIFPECDPACKDVARMFFGGKNLFYINQDANNVNFSIDNLMVEMVRYLQDKYGKDYMRNVNKYAELSGMCLLNGLPKVIVEDINEYEENNLQNKDANLEVTSIRYIIESNPIIARIISIYLSDEIKKIKNNINKNKIITEDNIKYEINNSKTGKRELLQKFNFQNLSDNCQLYNEFELGMKWLDHTQLFGILTNLINIKGGEKQFSSILNSDININYTSYLDKPWDYYAKNATKMNYLPQRCIKFCPYIDECEHSSNMITTSKTKRNTIVELEINKEYISLDEAFIELENKFLDIQSQDNNHIDIIIAQTGLGKSHTYIKHLNNNIKPYIIAVPTHDLKDEICGKCKELGYNVMATPRLPEMSDIQKYEIERLYDLGCNSIASRKLRAFATDSIEIQQYCEEMENVKDFDGHIITTHSRLLYFKEDKYTTHDIIIDEDIIKTLLPINKVSVADLGKIRNLPFVSFNDKEEISKILYRVIELNYNQYIKLYPIDDVDMKNLESQISEGNSNVSTNALTFLSSVGMYRYNSVDPNTDPFFNSGKGDMVSYISKKNLPDTKVIILSATINETIYKKFFFDRIVNFHYIGEIKLKGNLIQYPERSFSRDCLNKDDKLVEEVKNIVGNIEVITFKGLKEKFNVDNSFNFGNTEGTNIFSGKDIAIVGTPHLNDALYKMYALALGVSSKDVNESKMIYQEVSHGKYRFWFMAHDNEMLRNIQFWLVESELQQSIGRARLLRNECNVYLFSSFPISQAVFKTM